MKSEIFNVRVDKRLSRKLRTVQIEELLKTQGLVCPCCSNRWPRFFKQERVNRTLRVEKELISRLFDLSHPGKWASNMIENLYGYCPLCGQLKK